MRKFFFLIVSALFAFVSQAQVTVSGGTTAAGSYATLSSAVTAINGAPVTGSITVDVVAGHTETLTARIALTATGTAANPIVIQKSGAGANPVLTSYVGTALPNSAVRDGMFSLEGSDYVTIDGINLQESAANTTETTCMEYGYGLFKASVTDGAQNNTIKNCTVTLNRVGNTSWTAPGHNGSAGIVVLNGNAGATGILTPTAASGSNSFNKIYSNTIQNCNAGIVFVGFAATAGVGPNPDPATFLGDLGNDVGGSASGTGNTVLNFGGAAAATNPATGIFLNQQWSSNASYNTINNNNGSGVNHVSTLRGIFLNSSSTSASANCNNNNITIKGGATTSQVALIENGFGGTANGNTININNNTLTGDYLTATSGNWYGIYSNNVTPATLNINNNTISNVNYSAAPLTGSGTVYPINTSGSSATSTVNINSNTVQNISRVGTTGGTTIGIYAQGGVTGTVTNVNNNTISALSINGTGASSTLYGIQTVTGTITANGNFISNLQCLKSSGTGVLYGIYNFAGPVNENINNNTVSQLIHAGTGTVIGIYHFTATGIRNMIGNTIYNLSTAGATATGLHSASSSPNVYNNKIYDVVSTNAAPTVSGIVQGSLGTAGTATIYNNLIGDLRAPNAVSTTSPSVRGINLTTTTTSANLLVYYNTVRLAATSVGATFSTAALYATVSATSTTANLTVRNNIFVNNSTPNGATGYAVAYWRSGTALNNFNAASNNNVYYAGTPGVNNLIFYDGTNSDQTLTAYKTRVAAAESSSATENVPFLSTTGSSANFLHIDPAVPTQVESGGVPVAGITTDFDGNTRNASTPDIGADEGVFTLLDILPPGIAYTPLSSTCDGNARTLTTTITDASGVPTSGTGLPVLYWKINSGTYSASTGTHIAGSTYTFSFGAGAVLGDVVSYYVVAQDNATTPNVGAIPSTGAAGFTVNPPAAATPPTTPSSYTINGTLNGIYTVGATGTYPTLTAAVADYNTKCLTGPVTFSLIDASYSASETFPIIISQIPTASAVNTLTIKPATGVSPTISGLAATNFILLLNGADYIIIDGSNTVGGTTRDLTIKNINTTTNGVAPIFVLTQGVSAGATNNTVKNCIIEGPGQGSSSLLSFGMYVGGNGTPNGADNDNLTVQNNQFRKLYYGIQALGTSAARLDGLQVVGNEFGSANASEYIGKLGLVLGEFDGGVINGNTIYNIITSSNTNPTGLALSTGSVNSLISGNTIRSIRYTGTGGYGGKGIDINTGTLTSNLTFANNMVSDILGDGWSSLTGDGIVGFRIGGTTGGINIYHNTINLGSGTFAGNASGTLSAALYIPLAATGIDIRNNSLSTNLVNSSAAAAKSYSIYSAAANTAFTNINNNNYSVSGSQGVLGFLGSDATTLAALQTSFGGNANSKVATPSFVSATNLHLTNALGDNLCLNGAATPIAAVTTDIDGQTRNATTPDIGADEFAPTLPTFVVNNQSACFGNTVDLTAAAVTVGSAGGQTFTYFTDAACTNAVATPAAVGAGTFYIKSTYTSGGCSIDQVSDVTVTINALPATFNVTGGGAYCAGGAGLAVGLDGSASGINYQLQLNGSDVGSAVAGTGSAISFGAQTAAGTYTVVATDATTACVNTMTGSVSITINPLPSTFAVTGGGAYCAGGTGLSVGLAGSESGINYQLQLNGSNVGSAVAGTGSAISFGAQTAAGTYTVVATNVTTSCTNNMTGSVTVSIDPLPTQYSVTGGGAYCSGGVGSAIGLNNSEVGVDYQLVLNGTTNVGSPVSGTGTAISFGTQTTAGSYTVVATNATTACQSNMTGSVTVTIGDLPIINYVLSQPNNCNSNNGGADLTITGAAGPYTFNWTGLGIIQGDEDQSTLRVGSYTVVVSAANGCQATSSFTLFGPGGCDVCPAIGALTTTPAGICEGGTATLNATGLADLGVSYGIEFVYSNTPLANPYSGGTSLATVANGSLGAGGTTATATGTFNTPGNIYVYAILIPVPADPACRPFKSTQIQVNATPNVNAVSNLTVCSGGATPAVAFSGTVPGTIYTWTNNNTSIGLPASGTGDIASFTATNFTNAPVTSTITVTPTNPIVIQGSQTFSYTGAAQTWTVPAGVTSVNVEANGAQGGRVDLTGFWTPCCLDGGLGGKVTTTLAVTPGQVLNLYVGQQGNTNGTGGYNGGGTASPVPSPILGGAGGGGATDVRIGGTALTNRVVVAGAGGGAGGDGGPTAGGIGGGLIGGAPGTANSTNTILATGGTQTAGGIGGSFSGGAYATSTDGALGAGGGNLSGDGVHAGGGAGYYGGGGGTWAGGAGGSSFTDPTLCSNVTHVQGANTGDGSLTISYNIATSSTCPGPSKTFTITVNPTPTVNTVAPVTACNAATVSVPFTGFVPGTVYEWTNSNTAIGLAASGTGDLSFTGTNTTSAPISGTIVVFPKFTANGVTCTGAPISFSITINPTPTVNAVASEILCSGSATTAVTFGGAVTGTVYNWTNNTPSIGLAASGTGDIASFTAVNTGTAPVVATITVTPEYTNGGTTCTGTATTYTITVSPVAQVNVVSNQVICNGSSTTPVVFSTPTTGGFMSYTWTNSNPTIGLSATGGGNIASFVGVNNGTTPAIATITVTPTASSAPMPELLYYKFDGTGTSVPNHATNPPAGTAAGTLSGSLTQGSTGLCGGALIGTGTQFDRMSTGWATNFTGSWTLSFWLGNNQFDNNPSYLFGDDAAGAFRCFYGGAAGGNNVLLRGGSSDISVGGVNPASTLITFVYNGTSTDVYKNGQFYQNFPVTFTNAGAGPFFIGGYNGQTQNSFTGKLDEFRLYSRALNATEVAALTTACLNCPGTPSTFTITVNPTPTVNAVSSEVVCNGANTTAVAFSGAVTGTVYNWTNSNTSIGLAASGSGNIPSFAAVNTGTTPVTATVTVTPTTPGLLQYNVYSTHGGNGNTSQYSPHANNAADFAAMFNTGNSLTTLHSSGTSTPGLLFNWQGAGQLVSGGIPVPNNGDFFGVEITGSFVPVETGVYSFGVDGDDAVDVSIDGTVVTSFYGAHGFGGLRIGDVSLVAGQTYILRARQQEFGGGDGLDVRWKRPSQTSYSIQPEEFRGCSGTPTSYTITVNPTPTVNVVANQVLCTGSSTTAVTFGGAVTGTVYNWTNNTTSIGLAASGTGTIASFVGVNTGTAPVVATITVTPSFTNGGITCTGTPRTFTITVNPTPTVNAVSNQVICNGSNTTAVAFSGAVTGTVYNWTNNTTSIGLAASGTGNIASFAAVNTGITPVTATITVTPSYTNGGVTCTGTPTTFTITVNPTPTVNVVASQVLCNGSSTTAVTFTGAVAGTVYNWTNTTTSIGLAASGTGNIASFVGVNAGTTPVVATITVTPSFTSGGVTCLGTPRTFTITVNPTPTVNAVANQVVCNRSNTTAVAFSGAVTGTVYNWTNNTASIGLAASGTGDIAAFAAVNTTQTPVVATITVTPSFTNGGVTCLGTPRTFTITVNPTPIVTATDLFNQRICISDGAVALNGAPVGGTWSGIGVSGFNFIPGATAVGNFVLTYSYTNQYGCTSTDTTTAKVLACNERNISLNAGGAIVYPNPNGGQFNIRVNSTRFQYLQMRIYNALGQLISTKQWSGLIYGQVLPVDMRHLPAAVYTVRMIYDGGNLYEDKGFQMIIQH